MTRSSGALINENGHYIADQGLVKLIFAYILSSWDFIFISQNFSYKKTKYQKFTNFKPRINEQSNFNWKI